MNENKLRVIDNLGDVEFYDLEMPFKELLHWVKDMIQEHGGNAQLVTDKYRHFDYDDNVSPCFRITKERLETDAELERRLQMMRELQYKADLKDYEVFKKLKAKFEDI
ncbi:hypothetical protein M0R04_04975 [Candidatus Dojkabacteria bacterium]|jgi:hypothetical protein|nr:hypothetical protein [Candidatus Dojkabacteria bacterium]